MFKRTVLLIKDLFGTPKLEDIQPVFSVEDNLRYNPEANNEKTHELAIAEFKLQKDASQKQLTLQHRTMIIALIGMFISSAISVAAIVTAMSLHQNTVVKILQVKQ